MIRVKDKDVKGGESKMANRIREVRGQLGLSQAELSRLARIAGPNLSAIEHDQRQAWPKARRRLAKALKCTEAELFPSNRSEGGQ